MTTQEPAVTVEVLAGRRCVVERRPGEGAPVVFVNGCGLPRGFWEPVTSRLSRPAVLFDRPGIGTPWPGRPATLVEEVETLHALLSTLPGATVVAHSMASVHVEGLLLRHPGSIAGLVLVDPSIEPDPRRDWPGLVLRSPWLVARLARHRFFDRLVVGGAVAFTRTQMTEALGTEMADLLRRTYADPDALALASAEFLAYEDQCNDLVRWRAEHQLQPVPTTTLTAVPRQPSAKQREYAERLGARHVLVQHSGHLVMVDAPTAVLAAIAAPGGGAA